MLAHMNTLAGRVQNVSIVSTPFQPLTTLESEDEYDENEASRIEAE